MWFCTQYMERVCLCSCDTAWVHISESLVRKGNAACVTAGFLSVLPGNGVVDAERLFGRRIPLYEADGGEGLLTFQLVQVFIE